jgi:hypothetical protein
MVRRISIVIEPFMRILIADCDILSIKIPEVMFHFTCFNVEDPDDPSVGLFNGELSIPGNLLRREVFDPVIDEVRISSVASLRPGRFDAMQVATLASLDRARSI